MNPSDPTQQPTQAQPVAPEVSLPTTDRPAVIGSQTVPSQTAATSAPAAPVVSEPTPMVEETTPVDAPTTNLDTANTPTVIGNAAETTPLADQDVTTTQPDEDGVILRWQGTERIDREKDTLWFVGLGVVTLILMVVAIFLMQSPTFAILIPVMAAALVIYVRRPPAMISYTLSTKGIYVNERLYPYSTFKSFGVVHGEEEYSVRLIPCKRFEMATSAYFPEDMGEQIVDALGARLPMEDVKLDAVDRLLRKLRV